MIHFHFCESQKVEITPAQLLKRGRVKRPRDGGEVEVEGRGRGGGEGPGGGGLRVLTELPLLVL